MNATTLMMTAADEKTTATATNVTVPPFFTRMRTAISAMRNLFHDPNRLDQVLIMAQAVNAPMITRAVSRIEADESGARILAEQPRIDRAHVDFDALRKLPDGTLGREYTRFLDDNNIGPEPFEKLPENIDPRAAYFMLRMRQTHDIWHVLTGYKPNVRGEVLLQMFTYAQTRAPSAFIIAMGGTLRQLAFGKAAREELRIAFRRGKATKLLVTFRWEDHWSTPVPELRTLLTCPATA